MDRYNLCNLSGKIPSVKDELQISLTVGEISLLTSFKSFVGMEEGPDDFQPSRLLIISFNSCGGC